VTLRATGNSAALHRALAVEVGGWLLCVLLVRLAALRHLGRHRPAIWFTPTVPRHRYLVRLAAVSAGFRVARDSAAACAAFYFEDATIAPPPPATGGRALNFACADIRKSRVAAVFAATFGYPLALDPATWHGAVVEKSEVNGRHDGRVVACPTAARPGMVYQRLIDTVDDDGFARDLRTQVVGGKVVAVWVKQRDPGARFLPPNRRAWLAAPDAVFSAAEQANLVAFAAAMGADWAGLDVLRDRDGRIYVVDLNKTDAGPITALSLPDKLRSVALLGRALAALVQPASDAASASTRATSASS